MKTSSSRFKAVTVTIGFSFWFGVITSALGVFSIESLIIFGVVTAIFTQIFYKILSRGLDKFGMINTKIILGALFVLVFSLYGIIFKMLGIDLLRLKSDSTYWLEDDYIKSDLLKQY